MPEAFGDLLKNWRSQRRMSQMELGMTANVSPRHVSFLETGRARPSKAMVLRLSESLEVPRATRNTLLNAAGFAPAYTARDLAEADMACVREAMDWTLERHNPYPALAFDRHWRLLRLNACAAALLAPLHIGIGDSLLEAFMDGGALVDAIENRDEVIRHLVVRLRTESAHLGGDAVLDAAAEQFGAEIGDDDPHADDSMPAVIPARYRVNDRVLSFFSIISQFGATEDIALADVKIELMFPADESTRIALQ